MEMLPNPAIFKKVLRFMTEKAPEFRLQDLRMASNYIEKGISPVNRERRLGSCLRSLLKIVLK